MMDEFEVMEGGTMDNKMDGGFLIRSDVMPKGKIVFIFSSASRVKNGGNGIVFGILGWSVRYRYTKMAETQKKHSKLGWVWGVCTVLADCSDCFLLCCEKTKSNLLFNTDAFFSFSCIPFSILNLTLSSLPPYPHNRL